MSAAAPNHEGHSGDKTPGLDLATRHGYGDETAFEEVYRRFAGMVYNLCFRMAGRAEEAEDLAQEVFLRIHRHLGRFNGRSSLKTWIYRVTLNHCRSKLSRKRYPTAPLAGGNAATQTLDEARQFSTADEPLAGIACTAATATDRTRRGENRCHVAFVSSDGHGFVYSIVMNKGDRDRSGEENLVSYLVLNAIAEAKGVEGRIELPLLEGEVVTREVIDGLGAGK